MNKSELMHGLVIDPVLQVDGHVTVPERPGLGVELDETMAA